MKIPVALCLLLTAHAVGAAVLANNSIVEGKTIGEWSAEWWKWVFSTSTNENAHLDSTGASAHIGQPGSGIWFLGGHSGLVPDPMIRSFTVPEGVFMFMPVLAAQNDNIGAPTPKPPDELIAELQWFLDEPRLLFASIDGQAVPNLVTHRAASPIFSYFFEDGDNFKTVNSGETITGLIDPIVSDGYWLMIEPLAPGQHVLEYGGAFRLPIFFTNRTIATITIVPTPLEQKVEQLLSKLETASAPVKEKRLLEHILLKAWEAFERDKLRAGIQHLRAFQRQVRARLWRLNRDIAEQLISSAQQIIDRAKQELPPHGHDEDDGRRIVPL